ncbi:MAG: PAS domain-containing protein [Byssovorax sp.]
MTVTAAPIDEVFELSEPICVLDADFRVTRVNAAQEQSSGTPRTQSVGRSFWEVWPVAADPTMRFFAEYHRCMRDRVVVEFEEYVASLDRWIAVRAVPLHDGGIAIYYRNITAQRRAERDARESAAKLADQRELLQSVIDGTPSMIAALDAEGRILFVNEAAARFRKASKASFVGQLSDVRLVAEHAARITALHRAVLTSGQAHSEEETVEINGELLTVLSSRYPLRDAQGRIYGTAAVATDITAQKRIEADLRASEERARETAAELEKALQIMRRTEERLRQAQKMEAIGQLAGGVAHDFNNLLTVILGGAEYLATLFPTEDPDREEALEIKRAAERAAGLTRQLLAFSRRQVLDVRTVDINELVRGAERMLHRLINEDIELNLALAPTVAPCVLDPGQVEQVLLNLVVNARDAMPDGGSLLVETANVHLDAEYAAEHPDANVGSYVRLTVTDTGTGMTPEVRAHVFEPFFTTKGVGRGTGLGLSTVYGIVHQSGGHIWVYSEPGQGTTFKVYFPVAKGVAPGAGAATQANTHRRGKETVLLVEDDAQVRTSITAMLRRAGYHVIGASNGGEALLICEQHGGTIDLLLTDVVMPKLNGKKVAERLVQIRPKMRVIFMSGYTENAIVHHGVLDSGIDFLPKPLTSETLLAKVREVLDRAELPDPA